MAEEIINKVAQSALQTLDLEAYLPAQEIVEYDIRPLLYRELILKEKEFRAALLATDWSVYQGKIVAVTCSADAIIPVWAWMLVASYLQPIATDIVLGDAATAERQCVLSNLARLDPEPFRDQRVVVKGCGDRPIGDYAYLEVTRILRPVAKSIMYGEPCSTVPVFKSKL